MPAWFDIYGLTIDAPQDEPGIKNSAEQSNSNPYFVNVFSPFSTLQVLRPKLVS